MDHAEQAVRFFDWLTFGAILAGPIFAVYVTRFVDTQREQRMKKLDLFKILMRTRGARLNPDHVGALNLIEIEYYKEKNVLDALEKYFQHLNDITSSNSPEWLRKTDHLFTRLVSQMAKSLGYEIEQLQILSGGYIPNGWQESENRQQETSKMFLSLLKGEAALPIRDGSTISANPQQSQQSIAVPPGFPPPPIQQ